MDEMATYLKRAVSNALIFAFETTVRSCGHNPGQGTVRSALIFVCIRLGSSREKTA